MKQKREKRTIGWRERVDLPSLNLFDLSAKIDTGAYTGALHCQDIREKEDEDGTRLEFCVLDPSHPQYRDRVHTARRYRDKVVRSSSGETEHRYVIETELRMFDRLRDIELTITDRSTMRFPLLIGRKFLRGHYLIDVSKSNLSHRSKKRTSSPTPKEDPP